MPLVVRWLCSDWICGASAAASVKEFISWQEVRSPHRPAVSNDLAHLWSMQTILVPFDIEQKKVEISSIDLLASPPRVKKTDPNLGLTSDDRWRDAFPPSPFSPRSVSHPTTRYRCRQFGLLITIFGRGNRVASTCVISKDCLILNVINELRTTPSHPKIYIKHGAAFTNQHILWGNN